MYIIFPQFCLTSFDWHKFNDKYGCANIYFAACFIYTCKMCWFDWQNFNDNYECTKTKHQDKAWPKHMPCLLDSNDSNVLKIHSTLCTNLMKWQSPQYRKYVFMFQVWYWHRKAGKWFPRTNNISGDGRLTILFCNWHLIF